MKPAILLHDHVAANNVEANHLPGRWVFSETVYWLDCSPARLRRMKNALILFV
jgi:hypothetical protein